MRPFGVSTFIAGFEGSEPKLYQTEPSGAYSLWKAKAIGKGYKVLNDHLEKEYKENMDVRQSIKLAVGTLLETVESSNNIEICVIY